MSVFAPKMKRIFALDCMYVSTIPSTINYASLLFLFVLKTLHSKCYELQRNPLGDVDWFKSSYTASF